MHMPKNTAKKRARYSRSRRRSGRQRTNTANGARNDQRTRGGRQSLSNSKFPQEKGRAGRGIRAEKKVRVCAPARADPAQRPSPAERCGE